MNDPWLETELTEPALSPELLPLLEEARPSLDVDIACAGFGPATAGFLATLDKAMRETPDDPAFASEAVKGSPLKVACYERADDLSFGVSGLVTTARGLRRSFPALKADDMPCAAEVQQEKILYLLDPFGASRRSSALRVLDRLVRLARPASARRLAVRLPWVPQFLRRQGGLVMSMGQFMQWIGAKLAAEGGRIQITTGTPVREPILVRRTVAGLRLADQGVDSRGNPEDGFTPGLNVRARLTVVGDGAFGVVGRALDRQLGTPAGQNHREWVLGMKMVVQLPAGSSPSTLVPGTVWHTFGYPEPEIFGFLYVHPDRLVSVGVFIPHWLHDSSRTAYRYLQHYIQHPALWKHLKDGTMCSWGAKSLDLSGRAGAPFLCGNGYARIGDGSGSINVLVGSGFDEAWTTGVQLGDAVIELLRTSRPFTQENLAQTYERRRRASWVERGARDGRRARAGYPRGLLRGLFGVALAGLSRGALHLAIPASGRFDARADTRTTDTQRQLAARLARQTGRPYHDALLTVRGWPEIAYDGKLLLSQQDALVLGGKVHAPAGFADHVVFRDLRQCAACDELTCVAMCSGQAITLGIDELPMFDRDRCVHCGACLWNCGKSADGKHSNIEFRAGAGGLHSPLN